MQFLCSIILTDYNDSASGDGTEGGTATSLWHSVTAVEKTIQIRQEKEKVKYDGILVNRLVLATSLYFLFVLTSEQQRWWRLAMKRGQMQTIAPTLVAVAVYMFSMQSERQLEARSLCLCVLFVWWMIYGFHFWGKEKFWKNKSEALFLVLRKVKVGGNIEIKCCR